MSSFTRMKACHSLADIDTAAAVEKIYIKSTLTNINQKEDVDGIQSKRHAILASNFTTTTTTTTTSTSTSTKYYCNTYYYDSYY